MCQQLRNFRLQARGPVSVGRRSSGSCVFGFLFLAGPWGDCITYCVGAIRPIAWGQYGMTCGGREGSGSGSVCEGGKKGGGGCVGSGDWGAPDLQPEIAESLAHFIYSLWGKIYNRVTRENDSVSLRE